MKYPLRRFLCPPSFPIRRCRCSAVYESGGVSRKGRRRKSAVVIWFDDVEPSLCTLFFATGATVRTGRSLRCCARQSFPLLSFDVSATSPRPNGA